MMMMNVMCTNSIRQLEFPFPPRPFVTKNLDGNISEMEGTIRDPLVAKQFLEERKKMQKKNSSTKLSFGFLSSGWVTWRTSSS